MSARILGIDPGLRTTGYGAIAATAGGAQLIEAGIVTPPPAAPLETRLLHLHRAIAGLVAATRPDVVVVEELYSTYRNPLTAIVMGHARGVICLAAADHAVPVQTLAHAMVKRALTGSGAARKTQVNAMVMRLLRLRSAPQPNDVSDALALALAYANVADPRRAVLRAG